MRDAPERTGRSWWSQAVAPERSEDLLDSAQTCTLYTEGLYTPEVYTSRAFRLLVDHRVRMKLHQIPKVSKAIEIS